MNKVKTNLQNYPLTSSIVITFFSVGLLFLLRAFDNNTDALFNIPRLLTLAVISASVCYALIAFDWAKHAGLTMNISTWHRKWYLAILPFVLIAGLSSTSADFQSAEFSTYRVTAWLMSNFATGFFEEVMMRGLCFFILLKAWGTTTRGIYLAAMVQGLIFGIAHFGNLLHMPVIDVIAQVIFATLIGIGFAGLVYLTKSLWPAILAHTLINCAGTMNDFFVSGFDGGQSPGVGGYIVIVILFSLFSTLPGLLYLRASTKSLAIQA